MKFKFAPKGDYHPGQPIILAGTEWTVESVAHTGNSLTATTTFKGYQNMSYHERIQVILTDAQPIEEIKP